MQLGKLDWVAFIESCLAQGVAGLRIAQKSGATPASITDEGRRAGASMTRSANDRRTVQRRGILDYGDISIHDRESIERFLHKHRIDPYAFRRLHYALCVEGRSDERAWDAVPPRFRGPLEQAVRLHCLSARQPQHSIGDGATKFVFKTNAGQSTESVAMLATTGRTTACISSQVGCAAACPFCATGYMGLRDQLRCGEILDQAVQIRQWFRQQQLHLGNIVFMGMGEPLHNEPAVYAAIEQLQHSDVFRFSPRRIMVSTVGVIDAARRFLTRFPRTGFALSLHAAEQELREALIPLARFNRLPQLRTLLESRLQRSALGDDRVSDAEGRSTLR